MVFVEPTDGTRVILEGFAPCTITLAGTVAVGDPLAYSTGWKRASASVGSLEPKLIAGDTGDSGDVITAYQSAVIDFGSGCTATAGASLYLSDTAGDYSASTGSNKYIIGRMSTARIANVWSLQEIYGDQIEANAVDSIHYAQDSIDEEHMAPNSVDSDSYVDESIDNDHLADEVYSIEHITIHVSSPDNETMGLTRVWNACTVQRVSYWTSSALGSSVGIDILDGGSAGAGTDVIDSCSDNLTGWDVNDLTTGYVLSAGDYLRITFDDFTTTPNDIVIDIQLATPIGDMVDWTATS